MPMYQPYAPSRSPSYPPRSAPPSQRPNHSHYTNSASSNSLSYPPVEPASDYYVSAHPLQHARRDTHDSLSSEADLVYADSRGIVGDQYAQHQHGPSGAGRQEGAFSSRGPPLVGDYKALYHSSH